MKIIRLFAVLCLLAVALSASAQQYKNFKVSIYCRAYEVVKMADTAHYLKPLWDEITRQLKVDKVYIETHRDLVMPDQKTLNIVKTFFRKRGVEMAGGITFTISEPNRFQTFCYSNPDDRKKVKEIAEYTAKNFNSFILDDFFFTDCKDDGAIKDKSDRSWTQYRLELMAKAGKELVVDPAKAVNPRVKMVIKYPNWYEHFQGLGFNLEKEPKYFDGIYTGTETRDAVMSDQHLQPYLGYNVIRYFSNIAPGRNGGGWVDPGGMKTYDRYAEQLWITLFAKAPEETLFDFRQIISPINANYRAAWQGEHPSFDYDAMMQPQNHHRGAPQKPTTIARVAGYTFEQVDQFLGKLGNPIGIKSYRPYHSLGEDFLQNYLGMAGIPMDEQPEFPAQDSTILLTEEAKYDDKIVDKIKGQLTQGKTVVITSGLLKALQSRGIQDIAEISVTDRKALVNDFKVGRGLVHIGKAMIIPQVSYLTNDSWEMVSAIDGQNGWPMLHEADYSKGKFYVLTIPDNFSDLYQLPAEALNVIRKALSGQLNVSLEGPGQVSLYVYDNNTFIVESFLDSDVPVKIVAKNPFTTITEITSGKDGEQIKGEARRAQTFWGQPKSGPTNVFGINLKPHSYRVFRLND